MNYAKKYLSASTNGKAILVTATSTPGTAIHTAVAGSTATDEIWLYAVNTSAAGVKLTIEWGETAAPVGNIELTLEPEAGLVLIIPGLILQNSLPVSAFAATGSVVSIHGYVNRIS